MQERQWPNSWEYRILDQAVYAQSLARVKVLFFGKKLSLAVPVRTLVYKINEYQSKVNTGAKPKQASHPRGVKIFLVISYNRNLRYMQALTSKMGH